MFEPIFLQSMSWEGVHQWMVHFDLVHPNNNDDAKRRQEGISHAATGIFLICKCCDGTISFYVQWIG